MLKTVFISFFAGVAQQQPQSNVSDYLVLLLYIIFTYLLI